MSMTKQTGRRALILLGTAALVLPNAAWAGQGHKVPATVAERLSDGSRVDLPSGLPSQRSIVLVTQAREHTAARVAWAEAVGSHIRITDLALFDDYGGVFRGMVRDATKEGITDPARRAGVALVFGGRTDMNAALGISDPGKVHALVVDRADGSVLASEAGMPDAASLSRLMARLA